MSAVSKSSSSSSDDDVELRRGPWTLQEDTLLNNYIACHGEGRWNLLATRSGLRRTGKSCRLRWLNYLKPDVKRGNLTPQEQLLILELHSKWGNRWSKIAQHLPGRTDNEIKNYWRTRVQKQARHLKIDCNSAAFQEVIRRFWMPRLIQKMQGSSDFLDGMENPAEYQPLDTATPVLPIPAYDSTNLAGTPHVFHDHPQITSVFDKASSSNTSLDSLNMSQIPQISEDSTFPRYAMGDFDYNSFLKEFYSIDNVAYDMEAFSSAPFTNFRDAEGYSHQGENYTINEVAADSFWTMDNL